MTTGDKTTRAEWQIMADYAQSLEAEIERLRGTQLTAEEARSLKMASEYGDPDNDTPGLESGRAKLALIVAGSV